MEYVMPVWDEKTGRNKVIQIENRSIRYYNKAFSKKNIMTLDTTTFDVRAGKVTMDADISNAYIRGEGVSYSKRLLLGGYSSFIHIVDISYESQTDVILDKSRRALMNCPLDYIHGVRLPITKLTPSWIRLLKNHSIFLICIKPKTVESLLSIPWGRILEAAFPKRMMFVLDPDIETENEKGLKEIEQAWSRLITRFSINSFMEISSFTNDLPLLFLKRMGLYPHKGSFDSGSDADYFMYEKNDPMKNKYIAPAIIVQKGEILKAGTSWYLDNKKGKELKYIIPEQLLSIENIHRYQIERSKFS
ncbi:hypothetical protein CR203_09510 [Salipaludibacillus neizhouensis]|uniref:Amidohydrolase-related domain-containing protein n=1 Tax=Salipaludibacillus neizhouensis TaxID=885475 RepID=A0A3A9K4M6_9BACI|nr:hypothetical protein [Salipaludibacillus neizhouensis]RKL67577.1 hypothetical protein CR203_09510 [Salipaludibacillus neizhouensis]